MRIVGTEIPVARAVAATPPRPAARASDAAITHQRITLTPQTTIIHDEAALASTREQHALLDAVEASGARLIAVGDPAQNQPVGAGGLWHHIEDTTRATNAHVDLTRNQRARDPADQRDQALFRSGHHERAIRGYAARDHVHLHHDARRAEDAALDAADADRAAGKTTIVIAQTSNEHLDALNARAQAIRHQAGQIGEDSLPVPGRPYDLHQGDLVQIRRTLQHAEHGTLRNGTAARITRIDSAARTLDLRLHDGSKLILTEQQAADADLRLAYVQHPFPAQGHTTETTHLIIAEHPTREGTYVGLTRARHTTDIYATQAPESLLEQDRLQALADRMSRTDPDLPSIQTPLAHETNLHTTADIAASPTHEARRLIDEPHLEPRSAAHPEQTYLVTADSDMSPADRHDLATGPPLAENRASGHEPDMASTVEPATDRDAIWPPASSWPRMPRQEPLTRRDDNTQELDHPVSFQP